ncbi:unnamed protein product [Trichogramma brassicae]|uniref:Uncharacterized protein n=1 Tax=Trichogramma brassicae TaxID=86971 RepID=A0A6H5INK8_9HYME|nr:unnamed protein product [Trichogramma brassicae]
MAILDANSDDEESQKGQGDMEYSEDKIGLPKKRQRIESSFSESDEQLQSNLSESDDQLPNEKGDTELTLTESSGEKMIHEGSSWSVVSRPSSRRGSFATHFRSGSGPCSSVELVIDLGEDEPPLDRDVIQADPRRRRPRCVEDHSQTEAMIPVVRDVVNWTVPQHPVSSSESLTMYPESM